MKRKSIFIFCLIILCYFVGYHSVTAAIVGGTGSLQANGGSVPCSTGICYTTCFGSNCKNNPNDFTHIGLRFTLIDRNEGSQLSGTKSVTLLTDTLQSQLNVLGDSTVAFIDPSAAAKINITSNNWYDTTKGATIQSAAAKDIIAKASFNDNELSWYINENFRDVTIDSNMDADIVYNKIFGADGSGYNIIENYNNDIMGNVFGAGNSDKAVFAYIVNAMLGKSNYKDISQIDAETLPKLRDRSALIEVQIVGLMDLGVGGKRYILFGTSGELKAMTTQIIASYCSSGGCGSSVKTTVNMLFRVNPSNRKGNAAISQMNRQFYATISVANKALGNARTCKKSDWIEGDQYSCGVGIIDITSLTDSPTCTIVTEDDRRIYYGLNGEDLSLSSDKPAEAFINDCACDVNSKTVKNSGVMFERYSFLKSENLAYYNEWCTNSTIPDGSDPGSRRCEPNLDIDTCNNGTEYTIGDDPDCVFSPENINNVVYDTSSSYMPDSKKYTYATNEFCSQTCAEEITLKMPDKMDVIAGQYWTWKPENITLIGTRTCQATVDIARFDKEATSTLSGDRKSRIKNIYQNGQKKTNTNESYGLVQQTEDLKAAYDDYLDSNKDRDKNTSVNGKYAAQRVWINRPCSYGWGNCGYYVYYYCTEYQYTSPVTDEVFTRYEDERSACPSTVNVSNTYKNSSGQTFAEARSVIKEIFDEKVSQLNSNIDDVNECARALQERTTETYNFNPTVSFAYDDAQYDGYFGGNTATYSGNKTFTPTRVGGNTIYTNEGSFSNASLSYANTIDGSKVGHSYSAGKSDKVTTKVKINYSSSVYFYLTKTNFNTGVVIGGTQDEATSEDNYSIGNNTYPVSLSASGDNNKYHLYISNLGVYGNGRSGSGRFNKELGNKALDYLCYYNIKNDVTSPSKPEFFFRNVSLNNFDPNDRKTNGEMGKNWTSTKGRRTQCEIEGKVWDEVNDTCKEDARLNNPEKIYEEPEYSFTLTPENIANIKRYNDVYDFGNFRMRKVGSSVLDENGYDLSEGLWYTSDFIRVSTECSNCFTVNNDIENKVTWTKWTEEVEKLSGTGPAWK